MMFNLELAGRRTLGKLQRRFMDAAKKGMQIVDVTEEDIIGIE